MIQRMPSRRGGPAAAVSSVLLVLAVCLSPPASAGTAEVAIADMAFAPPTVQVEAVEGEPGAPGLHAHVIFTMQDPGVFHTVTFDDSSVVERPSGNLAAGQTYDAVITKTGTFAYHCEIHPAMKGSVVVARASTPPPGAEQEDDSGNGALIPIVVLAVGLAGLGALILVWRSRNTS